ncbi:testis-specific serine/threonine-protein kinase 1-like [Ptychodera flava]|uniref:testis-specific serine/threonine-protein kinase 1-like n=1 Tax=Ptychodera flava TaxID=63121 RepID=UPI00396A31CF
MEKANKGDLLENIKKQGHFVEDTAKKLFHQLVDGVMYLHSKNIVHRDLKCENILMVDTNVLKIGDFGFARTVTDDVLSDTFCGSAAYAPPEILQGIPYNPKIAEMWSLGVILYIILVGMMPYDDSDVKAMIKTQLKCKIGFPEKRNLSTAAKNLVFWMLECNPERRATPDGILECDWIAVRCRETNGAAQSTL